MFGFLKRQPPENKLLLAELKRISENYTGPNIFDRIVAKAAAEEISSAMKKDQSFAKDTISEGGWSARDAAYLIMSEFAASAVQSGHLHVYRGVMNDQGHAYLRLYKACIGALMKSGRYSDLEGVEALTELEEAISEVG
jgi:hypothetical protein